MNLTTENLQSIIMYCLFKDGEDTTTAVVGEGVQLKIGLHPDRLKEKSAEIGNMLAELPVEFQQSGGGGYTFLNACMTKDGDQWTGDHGAVDQLLALGIASGKAKMLMPREMWQILPGGMPYFVVVN